MILIPIFIFMGNSIWDLSDHVTGLPAHAVFTWESLLQTIFMVQSWGLPTTVSWNLAAWSISCEWLVYLTFPIFVSILGLFRKYTFVLVSLILVIVVADAALIIWSYKAHGLSIFGVIRVVCGFSVGVLTYLIYENLKGKKSAQKEHSILFWITGFLVVFSIQKYPFSLPLTIIFFAYFVLSISLKRLPPGFINASQLVYCGQVSYSLYLSHSSVLCLLIVFIKPQSFADADVWVRVSYIFSYLVVTAISSILLHRWVEVPFQKLLRAGNLRTSMSAA
ncbi:Uncharacterised protein [BD1-7 clade bacterium]|uniref:Acyltransferase 3 domain-containing protein n=1 Tax=BD1-7 clade bacterium TaxID=2029982 RepID=A0A5S9PZ12_9GAMM|nr:Uncharacterised protein [BD1-7 clade bacterium]CAA0109967.1 Uncharacterised protein [BD1-7 clade bacterium]CAA0116628.1 Uncharacterised protein [BD1-7 clade bacterium]